MNEELAIGGQYWLHLSVTGGVSHRASAYALSARGNEEKEPGVREDMDHAFEVFYKENFDAVLRAVYFTRPAGQDPLDISQEAFARTWAHWGRIGNSESPLLYTLTVARNLSRTTLGRALKLHRILERLRKGTLAVEGQPELRLAVKAALERLAPRQRWAIVLCDMVGLSSDEAAQIMGCSASTVRVHVSRARKQMRLALTDLAPKDRPGGST
jgi:RNA polymerase sigma-70 factor (ECF subfamily)